MDLKNKIKIYVSGGDIGYVSWLHHTIVNKIEDADLVFFTGGEDVDPTFYKQKQGQFTSCNLERDVIEAVDAQTAINLNKPIFGTCRGAQLGCVLSGGALIQHMNHPYMHNMTMYDGTVIQTNSLHHQMQKPFGILHPLEFLVLGYAKGLSNIYLNGDNEATSLPSRVCGGKETLMEPELVFYRKTNWLGIQGHPEMMSYNSPMNIMLRAMVDLQIAGNLDMALSLSLPLKRFVGTELVISSDEMQMYENMLAKRKEAELSITN